MRSVLIPSRPPCSVMNLYSYNLVLEGVREEGMGVICNELVFHHREFVTLPVASCNGNFSEG